MDLPASQTLITLDVSTTTLHNRLAREVTAHNDDLGYKAVLNAIVEHLLESNEGLGVVQPNI